jgi:hypothetical protein
MFGDGMCVLIYPAPGEHAGENPQLGLWAGDEIRGIKSDRGVALGFKRHAFEVCEGVVTDAL